MAYLPRTIEPIIKSASEVFKVVALTGVRQAGKSTCLKTLADGTDRRFYSLDREENLLDAQASPAAFLDRRPFPLLLDEIQLVPHLLLEVKARVDEESEYGQVWVSGSQKFALMKGLVDTMVGRVCPLELMPLSIYEREGLGLEQKPFVPSNHPPSKLAQRSSEDIWNLIWHGAWPAVQNMKSFQRRQFYRSLIQTYLERDLYQVDVSKLSDFKIFLIQLARRTGQELRINALAQDVGVTDKTIKAWLSVVENTGIIYLLRPYYANIGKQFVKSPKIYFCDTGLAAELLKFDSPENLARSNEAGAFFETFVVTELLKSWVHNGEEPQFYFYRDSKRQKEIDLLIRSNGKLHPVEIKCSTAPTQSAIKNFSELDALNEEIGHGAVISMSPRTYALSDKVTAHSIMAI